MTSDVPGMFPATFQRIAGESGLPGVVNGHCSFSGRPDPGIVARTAYPAKLVAVTPNAIPALMTQLRGTESQYSLARRSGVAQTTIIRFENGSTEMDLLLLNKLFVALGGQALCLAFYAGHSLASNRLPLVTTSTAGYAKKVGGYFKEQRVRQRLLQNDIADMLKLTQNAVSMFESGRHSNQRVTTLHRNFAALSIGVAYCAVQPLAQ